jgi:predicted permease
LVVGEVSLDPTGRYDATSGRVLYRSLLNAAQGIPGVRSATLASETPIAGGHSRSTVRPAGDPDSKGYEADLVVVGPRYFRTMGIPVTEGRPLRGFDDEPERVVVVNQALARMFWPGQSAVGKELAAPGGSPGWRVVGVADDVQLRSLRAAARPTVYYPLSQRYSSVMDVHVRTAGATAGVARALREAVAQVDPGLPVSRVADLQDAMVASMGETRTIGFLLAVFAGLALVLAAVGLYGLVAFGVSRRVRELGIRLALGARPEALVRLVLVRGLALAVVGLGAGLGLSLLFGRALRGLLFAVDPGDLASLGVASAVLLLTAALAAWLPARRAARVDAVVSLKEE